jgi:hypothetical protein
MTQYLISFGAHAMDHVPGEDAPVVARAARAVVQEAINASVYVSAGGLEDQPASIVATGGAVTEGPYPQAIGGFTLLDVPSREEALRWAAKIAVACRCAQEVRAIGADPELDAMLRQADSRR